MFTITQRRAILDRLLNCKRVDITPPNYLKRIDFYVALMIIALIGASISTLILSGITFLSLGIIGSISLFIGLYILQLRSKISGTSVKGDTLILNKKGRRSCVTSLGAIEDIKSTRFLGLQWTRLRYFLDGKKRSSIIVNLRSATCSSPEVILKKAIQLSKKQKANHKLGSVSVA